MLDAADGKTEAAKELTSNILKEPEDDESGKPEPKKSTAEPQRAGRFTLSDTQMVDNLILFLMAGFDSTSNTIAFAFHFLAKHPEVQERAYDEIMSEIGDLVRWESPFSPKNKIYYGALVSNDRNALNYRK